MQSVMVEDDLQVVFEKLMKDVVEAKRKMERIFNWIRLQNKEHSDVCSGIRPTFSAFDFTAMLKDPRYLPEFYPNIDEKIRKQFLDLVRLWFALTVQQDSLGRLLHIVKGEKVDKVALFRECESPRAEIEKRDCWVCFEAEMKLQIWVSQFETFKSLMEGESGSVSQLNMGEGKTQVIIPMVVLELLYGSDRRIPRINLLQALFHESRSNYYRFLTVTGFNIPIVELPFERQMNLDDENFKNNVQIIKGSLKRFNPEMLILLDQSSTHSLVLKLRDMSLKGGSRETDKEKVIFEGINSFDIFDEVDALMTPKKSFVYSVGASSKLDEDLLRFETHRLLIECFCTSFKTLRAKGLVTFNDSSEEAKKALENGEFPKGYRLFAGVNEDSEKVKEIREIIVCQFLDPRNVEAEYQFVD